jgi:hypothetical protein
MLNIGYWRRAMRRSEYKRTTCSNRRAGIQVQPSMRMLLPASDDALVAAARALALIAL